MTTTAEQMRAYRGPAILSYGLRPFFLGAATWAVLAVALWLPLRSGALQLPSALGPLEWHVHELIYGYIPAVMAGFLLTAVPNWTGRLPVVGAPLLGLLLIWIAGRAAVLFSALIGPWAAAVTDIAFLTALAAVIAREIVASRNLRNLKVLVVIALMLAGNITFHLEVNLVTGTAVGIRTGIAATILLITLIGGRIVPSFTRNWLVRQGPGRLPTAFNRFDAAVTVLGGAALASWCVFPGHPITAVLAAMAAVAHCARLVRWAGERTAAEPLVMVLHVAYFFVALGFALLALGIFRSDWISSSGALHAWTTGAIGLMTIAVMTRASLGHTGRPLTATPAILLIYLAVLVAAFARIVAAFGIAYDAMLIVSASTWVLAFSGFVVVYAPMLATPRK